jgi:hypothetical protein
MTPSVFEMLNITGPTGLGRFLGWKPLVQGNSADPCKVRRRSRLLVMAFYECEKASRHRSMACCYVPVAS